MTPRPHPSGRSVLGTTGWRSRARERPDAARLAGPARPPTGRAVLGELGSGLEAARLVGALPRLLTAPRGVGETVVDIPGWKAPEASGAPLRAYLRALGHDARGWGFGTNTGDPRRDVERLSTRVRQLATRSAPRSRSSAGASAASSRARWPAATPRRCDGSSPTGPRWSADRRSPRSPAPTGPRPGGGARTVTERLDAASPVRVPLTVVYSRRDGIVSWRACIDRSSLDVEHVEVFSTHLGMGIDPDVWRLVADRLARPTGSRAR